MELELHDRNAIVINSIKHPRNVLNYLLVGTLKYIGFLGT